MARTTKTSRQRAATCSKAQPLHKNFSGELKLSMEQNTKLNLFLNKSNNIYDDLARAILYKYQDCSAYLDANVQERLIPEYNYELQQALSLLKESHHFAVVSKLRRYDDSLNEIPSQVLVAKVVDVGMSFQDLAHKTVTLKQLQELTAYSSLRFNHRIFLMPCLNKLYLRGLGTIDYESHDRIEGLPCKILITKDADKWSFILETKC